MHKITKIYVYTHKSIVHRDVIVHAVYNNKFTEHFKLYNNYEIKFIAFLDFIC